DGAARHGHDPARERGVRDRQSGARRFLERGARHRRPRAGQVAAAQDRDRRPYRLPRLGQAEPEAERGARESGARLPAPRVPRAETGAIRGEGVWQVAADRAERVARGDGAQSACRVRRAEQGSAAARDRAAQAAREDRDAEVAALVARGFPLGSRLPFRRPPMPATTLAPPDVQQLIETRRDFHAHPELAFEETRTSSIVTERLRALGLKPATGIGKTGVVAIVEGGKPGKTVLLRADMDALPIQEENDT